MGALHHYCVHKVTLQGICGGEGSERREGEEGKDEEGGGEEGKEGREGGVLARIEGSRKARSVVLLASAASFDPYLGDVMSTFAAG